MSKLLQHDVVEPLIFVLRHELSNDTEKTHTFTQEKYTYIGIRTFASFSSFPGSHYFESSLLTFLSQSILGLGKIRMASFKCETALH